MAGWRRVLTSALLLGIGMLGLAGWLGSPTVPERFDAKTVVIRPDGTDGLRIREIVDLDTGTARRHGYFREVPNSFGVPTDVVAASPNAPDALSIDVFEAVTTMRVGDPDVTIRGRHRYVLEYTLPEASLADGTFALDVIGVDEALPTDSIVVVVTGMILEEPFCATGALGATGGCALTRSPEGYLARGSLAPGQGFTVGGHVVAFTTPSVIVERPLPPQRSYPSTWPRALVVTATAAGGLAAAWWWSRRRGRNEIAGVNAADAAFATSSGPSHLVTDDQLERLATIEFAPPGGITPWEGTVLLSERLDDSATEAWWAHAAALGRVELEENDGRLVIVDVPRAPRLSSAEEAALEAVFDGGREQFEVGGYDEAFATGWQRLVEFQRDRVDHAGWWTRRVGSTGRGAVLAGASMMTLFGLGALAAVGAAIAEDPSLDMWLTSSWFASSLLTGVFGAAVGLVLWAHLRASRTAQGSALALQTLSFRRFLAQSEGRHVEEAWKRGVLREYTAWAVALGEADTWRRAAQAAAVPVEATSALVTGALLSQHRSDFGRAHTKPSQGGSSGGGGFGSVGSGGGGGRSGSW